MTMAPRAVVLLSGGIDSALVAAVAGLQFSVTSNFLRLYVTERHLSGIGPFFFLYPPTAIAVRLFLRRLPQQFGRRRTLSVGLFGYGVAMACMTLVRADWHLAACGVIVGLAHALTFPSLIDLGSEPGKKKTATIRTPDNDDIRTLASYVFAVGTETPMISLPGVE